MDFLFYLFYLFIFIYLFLFFYLFIFCDRPYRHWKVDTSNILILNMTKCFLNSIFEFEIVTGVWK